MYITSHNLDSAANQIKRERERGKGKREREMAWSNLRKTGIGERDGRVSRKVGKEVLIVKGKGGESSRPAERDRGKVRKTGSVLDSCSRWA